MGALVGRVLVSADEDRNSAGCFFRYVPGLVGAPPVAGLDRVPFVLCGAEVCAPSQWGGVSWCNASIQLTKSRYRIALLGPACFLVPKADAAPRLFAADLHIILLRSPVETAWRFQASH